MAIGNSIEWNGMEILCALICLIRCCESWAWLEAVMRSEFGAASGIGRPDFFVFYNCTSLFGIRVIKETLQKYVRLLVFLSDLLHNEGQHKALLALFC